MTREAEALIARLRALYPPTHPVYIVLSAWREGMKARITEATLETLGAHLAMAHVGTTLNVFHAYIDFARDFIQSDADLLLYKRLTHEQHLADLCLLPLLEGWSESAHGAKVERAAAEQQPALPLRPAGFSSIARPGDSVLL